MPVENTMDFVDSILRVMAEKGASDVYIKADAPPILRIEDNMFPIDMDNLTSEAAEQIALNLMPPYIRDGFANKPEGNFIYYLKGVARFRVNVYKQRGTFAVVLRRIREEIVSFDQLGLPKVLEGLSLLERGLVIVSGPTGSGKSTSLASMIDYRNTHLEGHILTIEDPIEFIYQDKRSILSQREVGTDTLSYPDALESAVRQAPDVLLIGEMRDMDSVKAATFMAETGHLVLSTLHSNNATQTVERILQFFPSEIHEQVYLQLALNLQGVVAQRLLPRKDGKGRIAAVEVMICNARMRDLIQRQDLRQIRYELDQFHPEGMQSFDYTIMELYKKGIITAEVALQFSDNPNDMRIRMKTLPVKITADPGEDRYSSKPKAGLESN